MLNRDVTSHKHLIDVILDQFLALPTVPLNLPMPADKCAVDFGEAWSRSLLSLCENSAVLRSLCRDCALHKK